MALDLYSDDYVCLSTVGKFLAIYGWYPDGTFGRDPTFVYRSPVVEPRTMIVSEHYLYMTSTRPGTTDGQFAVVDLASINAPELFREVELAEAVGLVHATEYLAVTGMDLDIVRPQCGDATYQARFANESAHVELDYDGTPYSAASFDYNEDGQSDLFVTIKHTYGGKLFKMEEVNGYGVPRFSEQTQNAIVVGERPTAGMGGVSAADVDNDGLRDFLVTGGNSGVLRLYHQKAADPGHFEDWSDDMNVDGFGEDSWAGAWGDYDRDGQVDLYLSRGDANGGDPGSGMGNVNNILLKNDYFDTGEFIDATQKAGISASASTASVTATWMDIDDDGDLDLFRGDAKSVLSGTGSRLYINGGAGGFQDEIATRIPGGAASADYVSGVKWIDANNDGAADLVASRNTDNVAQKVFINDGNGEFDTYAPISLPLTTATTGVGGWDYDLDGRQDLLCLPVSANETPTMFGNRLVDGAVEFDNQTGQAGLDGSVGRADGSVACDYDGDGDRDLYFGRTIASGEFYYEARGAVGEEDAPVNNWVGVRLAQQITTATTWAIGARVTFHGSNDFEQVQFVDGGSGRGGQNDLTLICGVGRDDGPITCDVDWPSGRSQTGLSLPIGEITTLTEPTGFTLYDNTVSATYQVYMVGQQSRMDWIFTWETDYITDPARDRVLIDSAGFPCGLSDYELSAGDTSVDWNVEPIENGRFRHTMTWVNTPCVQGCTYTYTVKSERDNTAHQSQTHSLAVRFCGGGH